jgi:hypothetical protein
MGFPVCAPEPLSCRLKAPDRGDEMNNANMRRVKRGKRSESVSVAGGRSRDRLVYDSPHRNIMRNFAQNDFGYFTNKLIPE